jgi:hypothetical protein
VVGHRAGAVDDEDAVGDGGVGSLLAGPLDLDAIDEVIGPRLAEEVEEGELGARFAAGGERGGLGVSEALVGRRRAGRRSGLPGRQAPAFVARCRAMEGLA